MAKLEEVEESQQNEHNEDELGIPLRRVSEQELIPEEEQLRLIKNTGILDQVPPEKEEDLSPLGESILDTAILAIPICTLYIILDILIQQQYAQQPTLREEFGRVVSNVPILATLIHYTNKYKSRPLTQMGLFIGAVLSGPRLIWLVNKGSWLVVIRQAPPLGTIWVYTIVQLNLVPAMISLIMVYGVAKFMNWKLVF